jgi:hypothetical protein
MPNRIIKESICTSKAINSLSDFHFRLWACLITYVDDFGRGDARSAVIKGRCFPLRERVTIKDIETGLHVLADAGCILLYIVDGEPYLCFPKWDQHQNVRNKKSKYPAPELADSNCNQLQSIDINCNQLQADEGNCDQLTANVPVIQSNPNPYPNPYPNQNPTRGGAKKPTDDPAFILFWDAYPKKVSKPDAVKAWEKLKPDVDLVGSIMKGLQRWKESGEWQQNDGQFIPYPATWLNKRRWEDDIRPASQTPAPVKTVAAQAYTQRNYSDEDAAAWKMMLEEITNDG